MRAVTPSPKVPVEIRDALEPKHIIHVDISEWGRRPAPVCTWLFHKIVAKGEVGILAGRSNSGKGMLSMEQAACVATGRPLFGRPGDGNPRHTLIVQMEDSVEELERRFGRLRDLLRQESGWGDVEDDLLVRHMHFFVPNWEVKEPKTLMAILTNIEAVIAEIQRKGGEVGLIVLDTLAALTEGDENSVEAQRALWPACYRLRDLSGATVLVIHHVRKKANNTKPEPIMERLNFDALRGSTAIVAGARFVMQLEPLTETEAGRVGLDEEKGQRGGYAILGLSKNVSGPKGDTLLLEQQEGAGAGFWAVHLNSEKLCAQLRSSGAAARLSQDEDLLLSIAKGVVQPKDIFAKHWPQLDEKSAAARLKSAMNRLRNRHGWVATGRSMDLTEVGRRKVAELQSPDPPLDQDDEGEVIFPSDDFDS